MGALLMHKEILHSWKAIADHIGVSSRTIQRWEHEMRFPIRRLSGRKGTSVFAYREEVDQWMQSHAIARSESVMPDDHFRVVFERSPLPMAIMDDERHILEANHAALDLIRKRRHEVVGHRFDEFVADPMPQLLRDWQEFLNTGSFEGRRTLAVPGSEPREVNYTMRSFQPGLHVTSLTFPAGAAQPQLRAS